MIEKYRISASFIALSIRNTTFCYPCRKKKPISRLIGSSSIMSQMHIFLISWVAKMSKIDKFFHSFAKKSSPFYGSYKTFQMENETSDSKTRNILYPTSQKEQNFVTCMVYNLYFTVSSRDNFWLVWMPDLIHTNQKLSLEETVKYKL